MTEAEVNINERLQKIGKTAEEYKDAVIGYFKDLEVDVKKWNFSVGKTENEYNVEIAVKLGIKPKPK